MFKLSITNFQFLTDQRQQLRFFCYFQSQTPSQVLKVPFSNNDSKQVLSRHMTKVFKPVINFQNSFQQKRVGIIILNRAIIKGIRLEQFYIISCRQKASPQILVFVSSEKQYNCFLLFRGLFTSFIIILQLLIFYGLNAQDKSPSNFPKLDYPFSLEKYNHIILYNLAIHYIYYLDNFQLLILLFFSQFSVFKKSAVIEQQSSEKQRTSLITHQFNVYLKLLFGQDLNLQDELLLSNKWGKFNQRQVSSPQGVLCFPNPDHKSQKSQYLKPFEFLRFLDKCILGLNNPQKQLFIYCIYLVFKNLESYLKVISFSQHFIWSLIYYKIYLQLHNHPQSNSIIPCQILQMVMQIKQNEQDKYIAFLQKQTSIIRILLKQIIYTIEVILTILNVDLIAQQIYKVYY
ncbi:hypothetical protein pb186bvf_004911 [Paramecium bursaria]